MLKGCHSQLTPGGGGGDGTEFWRDGEFPPFSVNMLGLRDKRQKLSGSGLIRIGSACGSPSSGNEHNPDEAVVNILHTRAG